MNKLVPKNKSKKLLAVTAALLLIAIDAHAKIYFAPRSVVTQRAKMDRMKALMEAQSAIILVQKDEQQLG